MNPPQSTEAEESLDADAWIRAIEGMFTVFTLPCSEGRKSKFSELQLCGSALMWWEHYKSMQQPEYEITWEEFKKAFRDHHIPKALTDRKMRELLALKQRSDTVYQYAQKFSNLCQYGGYHVDTDMKKMELFREGLNSKLSGWLSLVKIDSYTMLVNKAISQEDAMKRAQTERKRKANSMPNNAQLCKLRIMQKTFPDFQQASQLGRLVANSSQDRTQENLHFPNTQQPTPKPIVPSPNGSSGRRCFKCGEPGHFAKACLQSCQTNKQHQLTQPKQRQVSKPNNKGKKKIAQARKGRLNFTSVVDIPKGAPVMMGTFSIRGKPIWILFDSGATHSFMNGKTLSKLGLNSCNTNDAFTIKTAGGNISSELVTRGVPLELGSRTVDIDLIILGLEGMDVILGMDWMNWHKVVLDISERMLEINSPIVGATTLYLPFKDGVNPCSYVAITSQLKEIPVVREFEDVFPDELPGMPPDRDVESVIELQPGTAPISKRPYRMAPKELA
jgi:hypothetical protein